ncbi:MAG: hypothetical protein SFU25_08860 [Candidatus Caenarcaniphilales bacterium]|nr:hypothetical protein [Candidatus Caenarcaniphilales bacterium]
MVTTFTRAVACAEHYGEVTRLWIKAWHEEEKGNYSQAIKIYKNALKAEKSLNEKHLRDCANTGTLARMKGAQSAYEFIKDKTKNSQNIAKANEISEKTFRKTIDEMDKLRPDLQNSCP